MLKTFPFKYYSIFILLILTACSAEKEELESNDVTKDLMQNLEKFQMEGDAVQYNLVRKEIENTIKNDSNKKLELYFETHDAIKTISKGDLVLGKFLLKKIYRKAEKQNEYYTMFSTTSHLGNVAYFEGDLIHAIENWKKSATIAEKHDFKNYLASTYGNIAIAYMELGYYNNSSRYFLKAKKVMDNLGVKDENYWINYINIANVYLSMNQAKKAIVYLNNTNTQISQNVKYLYYSNMSTSYGHLKDKRLTIAYLDSARQLLYYNPQYNLELIEQELDLYLQFNLKSELENPINLYLSDENNKFIPLKCVFNKAYFALNNQYYDEIDTMINWEKTIDKSDYSTNEIYFSFMASVFENLKEYKNENSYLKKYQTFQSKMIDERLKNQFEDILLSQKNEKTQNANYILKLKNISKESQLNKQRIIFFLLGSVLFLIIILILLVNFNIKKTKKLKEQELKVALSQIAEKESMTVELHEKLKLQNEKLDNTLLIINKINILKKHLDNFFDTVDDAELVSEIQKKVKSAKLDFKSFFSIYSDLAIQATSLDEFHDRMKKIEKEDLGLSKKEVQVAQLIINKYTTKEIALLLSRSVKNIEHSRSEIRKKLNVQNNISLSEYFEKI